MAEIRCASLILHVLWRPLLLKYERETITDLLKPRATQSLSGGPLIPAGIRVPLGATSDDAGKGTMDRNAAILTSYVVEERQSHFTPKTIESN